MWRDPVQRPDLHEGHVVLEFPWATREGHQENGVYWISRLVVGPCNPDAVTNFKALNGERAPVAEVHYGNGAGKLDVAIADFRTSAWIIPADGRLSVVDKDGIGLLVQIYEQTTPAPAVVEAALRDDR